MVEGVWVNSKRDRRGTESEEEMAAWIGRYRSSGLSLAAFANEHGLSAGRLRYWIYARRVATKEAATPVFHELTMPTGWTPGSRWVAELGLAENLVLRLDARADVDWVASLVESLRRACSR